MIYLVGEPIQDYREFTDQDGNLFDPPELKVDVFNQDGTALAENLTSYTKQATGKYKFIYKVPSCEYLFISWKYTYESVEVILHQTVVSVYDPDTLWANLLYSDNYANKKLNTDWLALTRNEKIAYLDRAVRLMKTLIWKGWRVSDTQTDIFPRYLDYRSTTQTALPEAVKQATCEVAFKLLKDAGNVHLQNQELGIESVKISDQFVKYSGKGSFLTPDALQLLKPYIKAVGRVG
jgi:hypothetical protein